MTLYSADAFFARGKTHMVCQDYARAGAVPEGGSYALLCDGCSSSPDTDFGARLLASAAEQCLRRFDVAHKHTKEYEPEILVRADAVVNALGLPRRCLDATLLTACHGKNSEGRPGVRVSLRGDGIVAARGRDGTLCFYQVEHLRGAPFYLSYDLDPLRRKSYCEEFGDKSLCRVHSRKSDGGTPQGSWTLELTTTFCGHPEEWFFTAETWDLVVLMSDGAASFQRLSKTTTSRHLETVPVEDIVAQVLDIKTATGSFLQRRCHKFLTNFCSRNEWQHFDDFAASAIWMGTSDGVP